MKIRFTKLGGETNPHREVNVMYAKNMKVLWLAFQWFGVAISFGPKPVDIITMFVMAKARGTFTNYEPPKVPPPTNRAQRRRLAWFIKKQRHVQAH